MGIGASKDIIVRKKIDERTGKTVYRIKKSRAELGDENPDVFNRHDIENEIRRMKDTLIVYNIIILILSLTASFTNLNPDISESFVLYVQVLGIIPVIFYLVMGYGYIITFVYIVVVIGYAVSNLVVVGLFFIIYMTSNCSFPYCDNPSAIVVIFIISGIGFIVSIVYGYLGVNKAKKILKSLKSIQTTSNGDEFKKLGSNFSNPPPARSKLRKKKKKKKKRKKRRDEIV